MGQWLSLALNSRFNSSGFSFGRSIGMGYGGSFSFVATISAESFRQILAQASRWIMACRCKVVSFDRIITTDCPVHQAHDGTVRQECPRAAPRNGSSAVALMTDHARKTAPVCAGMVSGTTGFMATRSRSWLRTEQGAKCPPGVSGGRLLPERSPTGSTTGLQDDESGRCGPNFNPAYGRGCLCRTPRWGFRCWSSA
jgi:hypothetical protein